MTTKENLPITEMLLIRETNLENLEIYKERKFQTRAKEIKELIPQVRTLELSLIEKAKKEERDRIVSMFEDLLEQYDNGDGGDIRGDIQETIYRINTLSK